MKLARPTILTLRSVALLYLLVLVVVPIVTILYRSFERGLGTFWEWITTPAAISALQVSVLIVLITVPLNVIFGVVVSLALVRGNFPGTASSRRLWIFRLRSHPSSSAYRSSCCGAKAAGSVE